MYARAKFLKSAASLSQLPPDEGYEVAFAGRSNAGKSTALNMLTRQKGLARTSKTPGRTQLINLFALDDTRRLVDLPGYGYAKVPLDVKERWQETLGEYLHDRKCLRGIVLLMDARHPFKDMDQRMIDWAIASHLKCHLLLSKADKLTHQERLLTLRQATEAIAEVSDFVSVQLFSALKREGLETLIAHMDAWYDLTPPPSSHEQED